MRKRAFSWFCHVRIGSNSAVSVATRCIWPLNILLHELGYNRKFLIQLHEYRCSLDPLSLSCRVRESERFAATYIFRCNICPGIVGCV